MYGYVCFYKGQRFECHAETVMKARDQAAAHFKVKPKHHSNITVVLAERPDGTPVIHKAVD